MKTFEIIEKKISVRTGRVVEINIIEDSVCRHKFYCYPTTITDSMEETSMRGFIDDEKEQEYQKEKKKKMEHILLNCRVSGGGLALSAWRLSIEDVMEIKFALLQFFFDHPDADCEKSKRWFDTMVMKRIAHLGLSHPARQAMSFYPKIKQYDLNDKMLKLDSWKEKKKD